MYMKIIMVTYRLIAWLWKVLLTLPGLDRYETRFPRMKTASSPCQRVLPLISTKSSLSGSVVSLVA